MATIFSSPPPIFSSSSTTTTTTTTTTTISKPLISFKHQQPSLTTTLTAAAIATILTTSPPSVAADSPYNLYYGTAASAANYGGYGGNSDKKDSAEYIYDVPEGWKERLISKVEKAPKDAVLNNLALSDVNLQDIISTADNVSSEEVKDDKGQVYYVYEIEGVGFHSLISVTCANNKLYAHFVNAPTPEWNRDKDVLTHVHKSFKTIG
ncbi:hypothetical protein RYX36_017005 [Vicia faba]